MSLPAESTCMYSGNPRVRATHGCLLDTCFLEPGGPTGGTTIASAVQPCIIVSKLGRQETVIFANSTLPMKSMPCQ